jgi:hypothetical protein
VTLPPGRDKLASSPPCTGSLPPAITIGMIVVAARAARAVPIPSVRMRSTVDEVKLHGAR